MTFKQIVLWAGCLLVSATPAGSQATAESPETSTAETLTLAEAVARALERSPVVQAAHWDVEAAVGRSGQAGARQNPEASLELENVGGTLPGFSESEMTVSLAHTFEIGGKRGSRIRAAEAEESLARIEFDLARLDIAAEVILRYHEALAAQAAIAFEDENVRLSEEIKVSIGRRVVAGAISPAESTRAGIDTENAGLRRQVAGRELDLARIRLASLWGETAPSAFRVEEARERADAVPPLEALQAELNATPGRRRSRSDLEAREAQLAVARSTGLPDVEVAAGYRSLRESGDRTFVAGVTVPLPFFKRNPGAEAEAMALFSRAEADGRRRDIELSRELSELYTAMILARDRVATLRERILPAAERAFGEIHTGYERGRFSYVDLLQARGTLTEARREEVHAVLAYHHAVAGIEVRLGRPLIHPITPVEEEKNQ